MSITSAKKKKRKGLFKRKRTLDLATIIDYKEPDALRRFITERGKIIPRRVSGATAGQQREICRAVNRARYLALLPFSIAHRQEKKMVVDIAMAAASVSSRPMERRQPSADEGDADGSME